jgi:hypothetical protein
MAHRKKFENWLETDCRHWPAAELRLIESNCTDYRWELTVNSTQYEISYSDCGYITLSSLPKRAFYTSEVREIYQGDVSEQSYRTMLSVLSDNFVDCYA